MAKSVRKKDRRCGTTAAARSSKALPNRSQKVRMGLDNKEARAQLEETIPAYKRAIQFLDSCGALTLENLIETKRIARAGPDDAWFKSMWETSQNILPGVGPGPGGRDQLRYGMRKTLSEELAHLTSCSGLRVLPRRKAGSCGNDYVPRQLRHMTILQPFHLPNASNRCQADEACLRGRSNRGFIFG
jgi:hypothetical protein